MGMYVVIKGKKEYVVGYRRFYSQADILKVKNQGINVFEDRETAELICKTFNSL